MSSDKFAHSFLNSRDQRQAALSKVLLEAHSATLFLSLNIPGENKTPSGSAALFSWALRELSFAFPCLSNRVSGRDALGPYAIVALSVEPLEAKQSCIAIEESHPAARLIDIDVYSQNGVQIDRASLLLSGRACLICAEPAVECIRIKRHSIHEVIGKVHELLAHFRT